MAELKASLWYIGYSVFINQKYNTNKTCSTFLALKTAYFLSHITQETNNF